MPVRSTYYFVLKCRKLYSRYHSNVKCLNLIYWIIICIRLFVISSERSNNCTYTMCTHGPRSLVIIKNITLLRFLNWMWFVCRNGYYNNNVVVSIHVRFIQVAASPNHVQVVRVDNQVKNMTLYFVRFEQFQIDGRRLLRIWNG